MAPKVPVSRLKEQVQELLQREKHKDALVVYAQLEHAEPHEARWPHRKGDLQLRMKLPAEAVASYERAIDRYVKQGFAARGAALAKVVLGIDPKRTDVLARIDGAGVRELRAAHGPHDADAPGAVPTPPEGAPTIEHEPQQRQSFVLDAPMLARDQAAPDGELRFLDAAEPARIDVALDEIVIVVDDDRDPDVGADFDLDAIDLDSLAEMPSIPLFADIPQDALQRMLQLAELVELNDGERLIARDEDAHALYILAEGRAEVVLAHGSTIPLSEGEVVGETCLLPDAKRGADVVARGKLRALSLDRAALEVLLSAWPDLARILYELLTRRLVQNLLRHGELFTSFDLPTRLEIGRLFEVRRAERGTAILEAGLRADALYVPLLGRLVATLADGRVREVPLGTMLGEQSMFTRAPTRITVVAETESVVLRLPARTFGELASTHAPVLARLSELSAQGSFEDYSLDELNVVL